VSPDLGDRAHRAGGAGDHDEAAEWHRVAEERRRQLERMQDRALYRVAADALAVARRAGARLERVVGPARDVGVLVARSAAAAPARVRARRLIIELRSAVAALPAPSIQRPKRDEVTAVIVTARQPERLDALLGALRRLAVRTVVVDNAGVAEIGRVVGRHPEVQRIGLSAARNYAAANDLALADVTTEWALLLNDDVMPLDDRWLDRMLAAVDEGTVAVGAQLVHGLRGPFGGDAVDGRVQHAGIGFVLDGPLARPVHLGRGAMPEVRDAVRSVPAATAACLLVRMEAYRSAGGLHDGFDYGSEDVDLCLRLARAGGIRVALGAVLLHEEGATRLAPRGADRRARAARLRANRELLDARHGPSLRRSVVARALASDTARSSSVRVGVVRVAVVGPVPAELADATAGCVGVDLVTAGPAALTVVTDPDRIPRLRAQETCVPVIAWVEDTTRGRWSSEDLGPVDLLVDRTSGSGIAPDGPGRPPVPTLRPAGADAIVEALGAALTAPRWVLRIGAHGGRGSERWGDVAVARTIGNELRSHGIVARVLSRDEWAGPTDRSADVTVHLKGRGVAPVAPAQTNILWVISHPSEVAPGELDAVDLVLAGSETLAERYRGRTPTPVMVLPQAADGRRFSPGPADPRRASRVLFVGNTRSVPRPVVLGAVEAGLPLTLVGGGWERYVDPRLVHRRSIPYDELAGWYRSADVVLNDHWEDMARWGLVSNRVFDALAAGTCVVSDHVPGMGELLDGAVVEVDDAAAVGPSVRALLADDAGRIDRAQRGSRMVLADHTWERRAEQLVTFVALVAGPEA
jgi:GT2 family glycosyltransferase